jgi:hypothetical protein
MELDDLKQAWQALERKLDRQHALELHAYRTGRLATARTGLRQLVAGQVVQAVIGVAVMAIFAPFWMRHWGEWHVVTYGVTLHLYGLMLTIFAGRDLVHIARIDYAAPVLEIQKRLAELRAQRVQAGPALALSGGFVWVPLVLAMFEGMGADVWKHNPAFVYWLVASGGVAVLFTWAAYAWARLPRNAKLRRSWDDHAAGTSLNRAQAVLDEIARFEAE